MATVELTAPELTRREILASFLGLPLAAWACRTAKPPAVPGDIVGASVDIGHRLRSPLPPLGAGGERAEVAIVGAGVAGLSAAWRLRMSGVTDIAMFELEPVAGGTARSGESSVSRYPWGAHYINAPMAENRAMVRLLSETGILEGTDDNGEPRVAEQFLCHEPEERVFYKGRWYEGLYLHAGASSEDQRQLKAFEGELARWASFRDAKGRRAFAIPMAHGSDDAEVTALDKLSMAAWLDAHGFTSPRLRWLVDYACRDDYGSHPEDTSAWAGLFYFVARLPRGGGSSKPVVTWPEGNGFLVHHLARDAAPQVSALVYDVRENGDRVRVSASTGACDARHAIVCAPQFLAPHIVPGAIREDFTYSAWMVANLTLADRPVGLGFPLAWDNVFYESPSLGYVTATHQSGRDYGATQLTYYYPLCDSDPKQARTRLLSGDHAVWSDVALSDIARAHPGISALTTRLDVMRWGHAMVRPKPGFIFGKARAAAAAPLGRIHFAHSDLSGLALFEEAFYRGVHAAEAVLKARGDRMESIL